MPLFSLDSVTWGQIALGELFSLERGAACQRSSDGQFLYVGAAAKGNSVVGFTNDPAKFSGQCLAIVNNGDGGAGYCTFQPVRFAASQDVTVLVPKFPPQPEVTMLVLAQCITHQCFGKYTFGYKPNMKRLRSQSIVLPVCEDIDGHMVPDWEAMESLGRELREKTLASRENTMSTNIHEDVELPELDFAPMLLTDVFEKVRASRAWFDRISLSTHGDRVFPFVSRSAASNGVVDFVPLQDKQPEFGNVITLGLDTQTLGYQPVSFYTSQNIQILQHENLNQFNALVLMAAIRQQLGKFSWGGNGATLKRLKATRIMVPVVIIPPGETVPDWEGMTAYGRAMRVRVENAVRAGSPSFQGLSRNA